MISLYLLLPFEFKEHLIFEFRIRCAKFIWVIKLVSISMKCIKCINRFLSKYTKTVFYRNKFIQIIRPNADYTLSRDSGSFEMIIFEIQLTFFKINQFLSVLPSTDCLYCPNILEFIHEITKKVLNWEDLVRTRCFRKKYDRFIPKKNFPIEDDGRKIFSKKNVQMAEFHQFDDFPVVLLLKSVRRLFKRFHLLKRNGFATKNCCTS